MRVITHEDKTKLEQLIDRSSLAMVLLVISEICHDKAEHIRTNWQDAPLARLWEFAAHRIDTSANSGSISRVSR
jgi:hypothetical protein